jgi:hypothetical protein
VAGRAGLRELDAGQLLLGQRRLQRHLDSGIGCRRRGCRALFEKLGRVDRGPLYLGQAFDSSRSDRRRRGRRYRRLRRQREQIEEGAELALLVIGLVLGRRVYWRADGCDVGGAVAGFRGTRTD